MVILVLALTRLPRIQRHRARQLTYQQSRPSLVRDILIGVGSGMVVGFLTLLALVSQPRASVVTPYYEANAKTLTGAKDIVGAIVVDFRAFDTLIEIAVFAMAGLGVYTLLRYASKTVGRPGGRRPAGHGATPADAGNRGPGDVAVDSRPGLRRPAAGDDHRHHPHDVRPRPAGRRLHRRCDHQPGGGVLVCRVWLRRHQGAAELAEAAAVYRRRVAAGDDYRQPLPP